MNQGITTTVLGAQGIEVAIAGSMATFQSLYYKTSYEASAAALISPLSTQFL